MRARPYSRVVKWLRSSVDLYFFVIRARVFYGTTMGNGRFGVHNRGGFRETKEVKVKRVCVGNFSIYRKRFVSLTRNTVLI